MSFNVEVERMPWGLVPPILCRAKHECLNPADFEVGHVLACREHIWLVLMHGHRKEVGKKCYGCIPECDNS